MKHAGYFFLYLLFCLSDLSAQQVSTTNADGRKYEKSVMAQAKSSPPKAMLEYQLMFIKDSCKFGSNYYRGSETGYLRTLVWPYENPFAEEKPICKVTVEYYGDRYKVVYTDKGTGGCDLLVSFYERVQDVNLKSQLTKAYNDKKKEEEEVALEEQRCDSIIESESKTGNDNSRLARERDQWRETRMQLRKQKDSIALLLNPFLWSEVNAIWMKNICVKAASPDTNGMYTVNYAYVLKDSAALELLQIYGDTTAATIISNNPEKISWNEMSAYITSGTEDTSVSARIHSYEGGMVIVVLNTVVSDEPESRATISEVFILQRVK